MEYNIYQTAFEAKWIKNSLVQEEKKITLQTHRISIKYTVKLICSFTIVMTE